MSSSTLNASVFAGGILAGLIAAATTAPAIAQQKAAPPDFSSNEVGWVGLNGGGPGFSAVPGHVPTLPRALCRSAIAPARREAA